jgi:hypothetical protein
MKLLWVCLSLFLIVTPMQRMSAQEAPDSGEGNEAPAPDVPFDPSALDVGDEALDEAGVERPETSKLNLAYGVFLPMIHGETAADDEGDVVAAFSHPWRRDWCSQVVPGTEEGLWDDMPGTASETGLFWLTTNQPIGEACAYSSVDVSINTASFRRLRIKLALNDGALIWVRAYRATDSVRCETQVGGNLVYTRDDNVFHEQEITLPTGFAICRVQIILDDDPNNVPSRRAAALIDWIKFLSPGGSTGWREEFGRSN